jgi:hypothetical protein
MAWAEASPITITALAAVATCIMKTRRLELKDMQGESIGHS